MQNIVILGSTGSIGKSSLEIIRANRDKFNISCLVASTNEKLITDQAREFKKAKIYLEKKAKMPGTKTPDKVPSKVLLGLILGKIKRLPNKLPKTKAETSVSTEITNAVKNKLLSKY